MFSFFIDGPEYVERTRMPFKPTKVNMVPEHCYNFRAKLLVGDSI